MEVLERGQQLEAEGKSIIHLEIGEPDFPTAPHICEAAHMPSMPAIPTYTHSQGIPELREVITDDYNTRFNLDPSGSYHFWYKPCPYVEFHGAC